MSAFHPPSLDTHTLPLPPSCVQFCPQRQDVFCVGTYFLHAHREESAEDERGDDAAAREQGQKQKRTGSLMLFRLDAAANRIAHLSTLALDSAVLDAQWSPLAFDDAAHSLLAVATSTGQLLLYTLSSSSAELVSWRCVQVCAPEPDEGEQEVLVLSLAWHPSRAGILTYTGSDGRVCVYDVRKGKMESGNEVRRHELEAWTAVFNCCDEGGVLSGGDDIALCYSPCAEDGDMERTRASAWRDRKLHLAGVTAILPLPDAEGALVVTGSYDDHIRLLRLPCSASSSSASSLRRRPLLLAELDLGGGVWRLKLLRSSAQITANAPGRSCSLLLASCMHAGARVVSVERVEEEGKEGEWRFEVRARFEEHESMNYASDAVPDVVTDIGSAKQEKATVPMLVVSTSFYDRKMCLWRWKGEL